MTRAETLELVEHEDKTRQAKLDFIAGKPVYYRDGDGQWRETPSPIWDHHLEYRSGPLPEDGIGVSVLHIERKTP